VCFFGVSCGGDSPHSLSPQKWLDGAVVGPLVLAPARAAVADLRWHVPEPGCDQVYVIDVSYDRPPQNESDSRSTLVLGLPTLTGHRSNQKPGPPRLGEVVPLRLYYEGVRVGKDGSFRDIHLSDRLFGPAAPTAPCYEKTWDPMEDALALGMPMLTGRPTAVGESWHGARVQGRCNRTACVDPIDRQGGLAHHLSCVTMSMQETLTGIYEVGGERVAAIESHWDDGHGHAGIHTDRKALLSLDHGRLLWARVDIHHEFLQVNRTFVMTAVDGCSGSPSALGAEREAAIAELATRTAARLAESPKRAPPPRPAAATEGAPD
jgi:hypothetical protein